MEKTNAKGIRQLAWDDLAQRQYWPYLGGGLVLKLMTGAAVVIPLLIMVGIAVGAGFATGVLPFDPNSPDASSPVMMLALYFAIGVSILLIPLTYVIGFACWGGHNMALAVADRRFNFNMCVSGWGHGWKMGWTVMVMWTYLSLWYLLIIPGIVKTFSYAMTAYVQIDHPDWTANQCIDESRRLMSGNRWRFVCLAFSFIGWILLLVPLAFVGANGIAQLFLEPYISAAFARFYRTLQQEKGPCQC